jgi:hypothetical protein
MVYKFYTVYIPVASLPLMQQVGKEDASDAAGGKM